MPRPRRDSRQQDGIIVRRTPQPTFATKSTQLRHWLGIAALVSMPVFASIKVFV
jgi:hypothetical protein